MQPHSAIEPAVIGIEIISVPHECDAARFLQVICAIVDAHGQHVFLIAKANVVGNVNPVRIHTIFRKAYGLAIQINLPCLVHSFKFNEYLARFGCFRQLEMLPIKRKAFITAAVTATMRNNGAECVGFIE